ncbi:hypothetical protein C7B65_26510 [Phormidesmis priestleyi ULC007]|uniref:Uncharacterized protein n=1 Tax=Phormidesmis priestleyi ULC007 TaxID=1920490 RepID=A0A2T1D1M4_9CYAN|nr:hypothetical protein [Phormidesmis priestleyi]PSB14403.1 hypothetical protein C7B65_26510 [Phormidesmis priestleyi ULC007]PZO49393.1 MAG: hypothetical protein DCF14_14715 [Phormidesmis priestleyi]
MPDDLFKLCIVLVTILGSCVLLLFALNAWYDKAARSPKSKRRSQRSRVVYPSKFRPRNFGIRSDQPWMMGIVGMVLLSALSTAFSPANRTTFAPNTEDYIPMPPPQSMGATGSDLVQLSITNSTPEEMRVFFKGVEKQSAIIPRCPECQVYAVSPLNCPTNGVNQTYTLSSGEYEIDILFTGANTRPYRGRWTLEKGTIYKDCFTLTYGTPRHDDRRQW